MGDILGGTCLFQCIPCFLHVNLTSKVSDMVYFMAKNCALYQNYVNHDFFRGIKYQPLFGYETDFSKSTLLYF